jgi:3-phosphoshikimate 1-carboxyvinyltransferase
MSREETLIVEPGGCLNGTVPVPGDKSISHRAVMFGSIAHGETHVSDCLMGDDVRSTIAAFRAMGVVIDDHGDNSLTISGRGYSALSAPSKPLDMGNSGTSIRLLCGLLAATDFRLEMIGDESLMRRPMRRVTEPLALMGANIITAEGGTPPLLLPSASKLKGIRYALPIASAQVKSAVLLAGLQAKGSTCVGEPVPTRDHTEHMLRAFGAKLSLREGEICIVGGQSLRATSIVVPADISSAAFFLVGAAIMQGSRLSIENVGINPTRTGVLEILRRMGANIELSNRRSTGSEPVADIHVRGAPLRAIDIPSELVPSAIDEFPALFIAAACAEGTTRLLGASELRHKESDRIDAMAEGLRSLGIGVLTSKDSIQIDGSAAGFEGGTIDSYGDHRIAMAFAMAGLKARKPITLHRCEAIRTSFPGFVETAQRAGLKVRRA